MHILRRILRGGKYGRIGGRVGLRNGKDGFAQGPGVRTAQTARNQVMNRSLYCHHRFHEDIVGSSSVYIRYQINI